MLNRAPSCLPLAFEKTSWPVQIRISPFSPRGTVCFGCVARKLGLYLPIILMLSRGVTGTGFWVWKFLLRAQKVGGSSEAAPRKDSSPEASWLGDFYFLEWCDGRQVGVPSGSNFLPFQWLWAIVTALTYLPCLQYSTSPQMNYLRVE